MNFVFGAVKKGRLLDNHLFDNHYDEFAKFGRTDIFNNFDEKNIVPRIEYDNLGDELKRYIENDKPLMSSEIRSLDCHKSFGILSNVFIR